MGKPEYYDITTKRSNDKKEQYNIMLSFNLNSVIVFGILGIFISRQYHYRWDVRAQSHGMLRTRGTYEKYKLILLLDIYLNIIRLL